MRRQHELDTKVLKFFAWVLGIVILAMVLLALFTSITHPNSSQTNKQSTTSSRHVKKADPIFDNEHEKKQIREGLHVGMQVISETKSLPMVKMNLDQLSSSTANEMKQYFAGEESIQELNDLTNLATRDGQWYHGDGGSDSNGAVKSPKRGTLNEINFIEFETYTKDNDYESIKIRLDYTPKGFESMSKDLIIKYDPDRDQIVEVLQG